MSLDASTVNTYNQLKNRVDAAYKVFRRDPSVTHAARHTTEVQAFKTFCVETMATLVGDFQNNDNKEEILNNFDLYKTCKQCAKELLFLVNSDHYIVGTDFEEAFPGWCYDCLLNHCNSHDCTTCVLTSDPNTCKFKEVKTIYNT